MKDFYDVYFFLKKLNKEINLKIFKQALNNTLINRDTFEYYNDYEQILNEILNNDRINAYWRTYIEKNKYARDIEFKDIINMLIKFIDDTNNKGE